jgi:hypothetical protein
VFFDLITVLSEIRAALFERPALFIYLSVSGLPAIPDLPDIHASSIYVQTSVYIPSKASPPTSA